MRKSTRFSVIQMENEVRDKRKWREEGREKDGKGGMEMKDAWGGGVGERGERREGGGEMEERGRRRERRRSPSSDWCIMTETVYTMSYAFNVCSISSILKKTFY